MGLQADILIHGAINVPKAYHRIDGVTGGKRGYSAKLQVFASREAAHAGLTPLRECDFSFAYVPGRDPIELAYLVAPGVEGIGADLQPVLEEGQEPGTLPAELQPKAEDSAAADDGA